MPPKPPLLHLPPTRSEKWWNGAEADRPKASFVNGPAVVAATAVSFALVVSVVAWIVAHPNAAPRAAMPTPTFTAPAPPPLVDLEPPVRKSASPARTIAAVHRPDRRDVLIDPVAPDDEAPPPLPPPSMTKHAGGPAAQKASPQPAGQTYGTQVFFLNNPAAAAESARRDKKLLFVMHISGNFEDSCFT